ncbi:MAG: hypothetical protein AAF497_12410, partial [Planctomycetota bacterium]
PNNAIQALLEPEASHPEPSYDGWLPDDELFENFESSADPLHDHGATADTIAACVETGPVQARPAFGHSLQDLWWRLAVGWMKWWRGRNHQPALMGS